MPDKPSKEEKLEDIKQRGNVRVALIGAAATIMAALIAFLGLFIARTTEILPSPTSAASPSLPLQDNCTYPPRYGFECGQYGWDKTSFIQSQAILDITTTQFNSPSGIPSQVLALTVDFTGTIATRNSQGRSSGEAQVDLYAFPPAGYETKDLDLRGLTVVAWIWAPEGSIGDINHKNGIQLFIKDDDDNNCYGKWTNIEKVEVWFQVRWQENNAALCKSGFDSSNPKLLGIKISVGENSNWFTDTPLIFYLDDVNWDLP